MDENSKYAKELLTEGEKLAKGTWAWLVKGIDDPYKQALVATLCENQTKNGGQMQEYGAAVNENINESTLSTNIYGVNQILLPVIRRVYPNLMANNWVSIQPMLSPISLIFYMRYYYNGSKSNTTAGDEFLKVPLNQELGFDPYYSSAKNVISAGTYTALQTTVNAAASTTTKGFARFTPLNSSVFARAYTGSVLVSEVQFQGVYGAATVSAVPVKGSSPAALAAATYNSSSKQITLAAVAGADKFEVEWMYDQEQAGDFASGNGIPELDIRIKTDPIQARERKLKTQWTLEAAEDLKVMHNVDPEKELVNLMASQMLAEIDREILKELMDSAVHRTTHDFTADTANNAVGNIIDRNQALAMKLGGLSAAIHKATRVSGANFLVTSPLVAQRLAEVRGYVPVDTSLAGTTYGIQAAGSMSGGEVKIYKDPLFPDNRVLMGYKGKTFLDSGYFYCPYVPVKTTPIIYDPDTLQPRRGMITRYGSKMVDGGEYFYGTMDISNLT